MRKLMEMIGHTFELLVNFWDGELLIARIGFTVTDLLGKICSEPKGAVVLRREADVDQFGVIFVEFRAVPIVETELELLLLFIELVMMGSDLPLAQLVQT